MAGASHQHLPNPNCCRVFLSLALLPGDSRNAGRRSGGVARYHREIAGRPARAVVAVYSRRAVRRGGAGGAPRRRAPSRLRSELWLPRADPRRREARAARRLVLGQGEPAHTFAVAPQIFMCRVSGISRSESSSATAGTAMEYASVRPRLCVAVQTAVVMSGTAPPPQPLPM